MGNYSGNTIRPKKVFNTSDGTKTTGQTDAEEFAGAGATTGVAYGPNGIANGTSYYLSANASAGSATNAQDAGKGKGYREAPKAQLDTTEWGITREAAIARL